MSRTYTIRSLAAYSALFMIILLIHFDRSIYLIILYSSIREKLRYVHSVETHPLK